jgi:hypothetical protein
MCIYVSAPSLPGNGLVAMHWFSYYIHAAINTYATIKELFDTFSMQSMPYQRKIGDQLFPVNLAFIVLLM